MSTGVIVNLFSLRYFRSENTKRAERDLGNGNMVFLFVCMFTSDSASHRILYVVTGKHGSSTVFAALAKPEYKQKRQDKNNDLSKCRR